MLTTTPSRDEAQKNAKLLLAEKLAACVQLLPVESTYTWQEKDPRSRGGYPAADQDPHSRCSTAVTARIKAVHSYTVPEIVALPFAAGFQGYFDWISRVTAAPPSF